MVTKKKRGSRRLRAPAVAYDVKPGAAARFAREIPAGEFKARCLALMDEVQHGGGEYVITKHGRPVARLVPVHAEPRRLLGSMAGTVTVLGDIVSPIDESWEVSGDAHEQ